MPPYQKPAGGNNYLSSLTTGQFQGRNQLQTGLNDGVFGYENWMGSGEPTGNGVINSADSYLKNSYKNDMDFAGAKNDSTVFSMDSMFGGESGGGWVNGISSIGTALVEGYLGYRALGVAEDTLAHQKNMDISQYNNQVQGVNQGNTEHYLARVARSGNSTYQGKTQEQYEKDTHIDKMG